MSLVTLNIHTEPDSIQIFGGDATVPEDTATLRGYVELRLTRPVQLKQITVQLEGVVRSIVCSDIPRSQEEDDKGVGGFLSDSRMWPSSILYNGRSSSFEQLPLMDRLSRRALHAAQGYSTATHTVLRHRTLCLPEHQPAKSINAGVTRWPFIIHIDNLQQLPPSLHRPLHSVRYEVSAKLQLASFREKVRVTCWNLSFRLARRSSKQIPSLDAAAEHDSELVDDEIQARRSSTHGSSRSMSVISSSRCSPEDDTCQSQHEYQRQQPGGTRKKLKPNYRSHRLFYIARSLPVYRHTYASLQLLVRQPRVRYRGCRQEVIRYEVNMRKHACLQQGKFEALCHFEPLSAQVTVSSVTVYLEQTEKYPLRAGKIEDSEIPLDEDSMVSRIRRLSRTRHTITDQEQLCRLRLSVQLDSPQVAQDIDAMSLKISHRLRMIVHFEDRSMRKMSLSFPLEVITVPQSGRGPGRMSTLLDQVVYNGTDEEDEENGPNDGLPSYRDVLHEGPPPAAFFDDDLSHHPSVFV
ncbi:hypothetical protein BCR43DRAFT_525743 [Syncephalastrum racemosum]|uniref:Arrestin-like N-terminal domain-containing protein n=1 Tax=Syncephalastrum racemosum TaxID=13706 RepID=A0A1X2H8Z9_SYNRA|nr:hypothetical protein BCR43DRAFT_525743 [Syncephalastrum racemosum]